MLSQTSDNLARQDASPLYMQLKNSLTEAIQSGRYAPGDPVPTETQLCAQYGVSRITVRRAISELQDEGLLEKRHGKGTFVSFRRMETSLVDLAGFSDSYSLMGYKVSKVLLGIEPGSADLLVSLLSSVTSLTTSAAEAQERGTVTTLRSPALSTRSTMVSRRLMTAARPVISNTLEGS